MGRVVQWLVCITAMSSVLCQSYYHHQPYALHSNVRSTDLHYRGPISESHYTRTPETTEYKRLQEHEIENGDAKAKREIFGTMEDRIVFPEDSSSTTSVFSKPLITEECRRRDFCTGDEVSNYPEKFAKKIVVEGRVRKQDDSRDESSENVSITQRLGGDSNDAEISLCVYNQTKIFPRTLPDRNGNHHFVVNPNGMEVQGFFVELCELRPNGKPSNCSPLAAIRDGYQSACKQSYVYRLIDVIENDRLVQKQLKLPGCCSCIIKKV